MATLHVPWIRRASAKCRMAKEIDPSRAVEAVIDCDELVILCIGTVDKSQQDY